ncbi:hypothetical protein M885DRAFT_535064 [Pelagophyceae sp. CCMP2097]|nr:hypothetical protein M885DRAFT_535064 [Pelagophyceae sp. CCMP2097]
MNRRKVAVVGAVAVAAAALLALRMRRRCAAGAARRRLLDRVKALDKSTFYVVSNARGDGFSDRSLATLCRARGLAVGDSTLHNAQIMVDALEEKRQGLSAVTFGPPRVQLKHALVRGCVSAAALLDKFDEMREAYVQQPLDYGRNSRYGDKWRISCYLVVLERWKPAILPHAPMVACLGGVMRECAARFEEWYADRYDLAACEASVMNCFLTRYRPVPGEDELRRHIDGGSVDGSVVLALPTRDAFDGGDLRVWDARREFAYQLAPGDSVFLDTKVWHQATPISTGERWALVLFLRLKKTPK